LISKMNDKKKGTLKSKLIKELALKSYNTQDTVKPIINAFIELIIEDTIKTGKVSLPGLGTFFLDERAERMGRNPRTGESINIPRSYVPRFRSSARFKAAAAEEYRRQEAQRQKIKKAEIAKAKRLAKSKAKAEGKTSVNKKRSKAGSKTKTEK